VFANARYVDLISRLSVLMVVAKALDIELKNKVHKEVVYRTTRK
jgi:hypothetical protein